MIQKFLFTAQMGEHQHLAALCWLDYIIYCPPRR